MLNIISRSWDDAGLGAIHKVVRNLAQGLDRIGYPYVVNKALDTCQRLWIHDDYRALIALRRLDRRIRVIAGPNIFSMPRDIPRSIWLPPDMVYVHPSQWVVKGWQGLGYVRTRLDYWPVGIDAAHFPARDVSKLDRVLFYYKDRDPPGADGAARIEAILKKSGIHYQRINYGSYRQNDYLDALRHSRYAVWYGRQESQGLALQEALAMGCPMIVVDAATIGDWSGGGGKGTLFTESENNIVATSAPYFDNRCGVKIQSISLLEEALRNMEQSFARYLPRQFIAENLTPEICARDLVSKFDRHWETLADPAIPSTGNFRPYRPPLSWFWYALRHRLVRVGAVIRYRAGIAQ